jgi:hypothetical protein
VRIFVQHPLFSDAAFPEQERADVRTLHLGLSGFSDYLSNVAACLALFDSCHLNMQTLAAAVPAGEPMPPAQRRQDEAWFAWQFIAGRDGAIQIFNFGEAMEAAQTTGRLRCPVLWSHVDEGPLKDAQAAFARLFPHSETIRHAVAHQATMAQNAARWQDRAVKKHESEWLTAVDFIAHGNFRGRQFITTVKGKLVDYELSQQTLDRMIEIALTFYRGFVRVEAASAEWQKAEAAKAR